MKMVLMKLVFDESGFWMKIFLVKLTTFILILMNPCLTVVCCVHPTPKDQTLNLGRGGQPFGAPLALLWLRLLWLLLVWTSLDGRVLLRPIST